MTGSAGSCPGFITELIQRCAQGDEAALGSLFDVFIPLVLAIVGGGVASPAAEAMAVETFQRVWLSSASFDPATSESVTWVLDHARAVRGTSLAAA